MYDEVHIVCTANTDILVFGSLLVPSLILDVTREYPTEEERVHVINTGKGKYQKDPSDVLEPSLHSGVMFQLRTAPRGASRIQNFNDRNRVCKYSLFQLKQGLRQPVSSIMGHQISKVLLLANSQYVVWPTPCYSFKIQR